MHKLFRWTRKSLNIFKNFPEKNKNFKAICTVLDYLKPKIFFVGQPWWPTFFQTLALQLLSCCYGPALRTGKNQYFHEYLITTTIMIIFIVPLTISYHLYFLWKFRACYITGQWPEFTVNNATLYLRKLSWYFFVFFFIFLFLSF